MRRPLFILVALLASGRMAFGCSSDADTAPASPDAGRQDVSFDAAIDRRPPFPDAANPDPPPPEGLPEGWELERSYSKHCGFYIPKSKETLPPPIRWELCPATAMPAGVDCRLMAIDGEPGSKWTPAGAEAAWVRSDGSVVLAAYRSTKPSWAYRFIADADGSVHTAILETNLKLCSLGSARLNGGRYALTLYELESGTGGGLIAGDLTHLAPRVAIHLTSTTSHSAYPGPFAILDLTAGFTFDQYAWTDGARLPSLWSAGQDNGLQQGVPVFTDGAIFWPSHNLRYQKTKVYTPATGVRDFLTAGMVTTRGHDELGTDGKDLVWIDAQGRTTETGPYDTLTIMTAPFTTEPTQVAPRRLRTEEGPGFGASHFIVGCGHAARSNGEHVRVVRLSDGQSWKLPNVITEPWGWTEPLAFTCTELFATIRIAGVTRLARVRLDSLGPGIPPD